MIPLCIPNISGNEGSYLAECVASTFVSSVGPFVDRFETQLCAQTGAASAAVTSAGTTALHAALHSLGVGPGDHVIIPALTFIATANAVAHCHAQPIIVDVDAERWGMDASLVAELLETQCDRGADGVLRYRPTGGAIKALMPVFAMGLPADMDALRALGDTYAIPIVADAAAAIGARYKGRDVAATGADLTTLSFNGNKLVTAGGGGAIVSMKASDGPAFKHLTSTARVGSGYDHDRVGFNYRMTNLQAAVGVAQLERLDEFLGAKAGIAHRYAEAFAALPGVQPFPALEESVSSHWLSGIYLPDATPEDIEALRAALIAGGVEGRPFWKPIHQQAPFSDCPQHLPGRADALWGRIQPLPCSSQLSAHEQAQVIEVVTRALS